MPYLEILDPSTNGRRRVLFRYDPQRDLVEITGAHGLIVVDLQRIKEDSKPNPTHPMDGRDHDKNGG